MAYITEQSLSLADAIAKKEYGKTYSEMNAERNLLNEVRVRSIVLLFTKAQMPIEEIAEGLKLDVKTVSGVLKKQKLIQK